MFVANSSCVLSGSNVSGERCGKVVISEDIKLCSTVSLTQLQTGNKSRTACFLISDRLEFFFLNDEFKWIIWGDFLSLF